MMHRCQLQFFVRREDDAHPYACISRWVRMYRPWEQESLYVKEYLTPLDYDRLASFGAAEWDGEYGKVERVVHRKDDEGPYLWIGVRCGLETKRVSALSSGHALEE
ncbi:hypothetical protein [Catalinimonas alkaloidigena]|nr:hypothetical protein [Catalinimonas alkaloidigena]